MLAILLSLHLAAAAAPPCPMTRSNLIGLEGRELRVSDIVDKGSEACLHLLSAAGSGVIAEIAGTRSHAVLSLAQLAAAANRRFDELEITCGDAATCARAVTIEVKAPADPARSRGCTRLVSTKTAGEVIGLEDIQPAECDGEAGRADVTYDADAGVLRANRALLAGTSLGRLKFARRPAHLAGDRVTITSFAGPVRVDQSVTLLQSAEPGRSVFVRTGSGAALAVRVVPNAEDSP